MNYKVRCVFLGITSVLATPAIALADSGENSIGRSGPSVAEYRAGADSSGGGDGIVQVNDSVILADPFLKRSWSYRTASDLHPQLRANIERTGRLLGRYGATLAPLILHKVHGHTFEPNFTYTYRYSFEFVPQSEFVQNHILDPNIEYHLVEALPEECEGNHREYYTEEGEESVPVACTSEMFTWIVGDIFSRMNIREQTKLIFHERIRAIPPSKRPLKKVPLDVIADVTSSLDLILDLDSEQRDESYRYLSDHEIAQLNLLRKRMVNLGLSSSLDSNWIIHRNGGGLVHVRATIDEAAFIGVGSRIGPDSSIAAGSMVINSHCPKSVYCELSTDASLIDSVIWEDTEHWNLHSVDSHLRLRLSEGSIVSNSVIYYESNIFDSTTELAPGSHIGDSLISQIASLKLEENSAVERVFLYSLLGTFQSSEVYGINITLGINSSLRNHPGTIKAVSAAKKIGGPWDPNNYRPTLRIPAAINIDFFDQYICGPVVKDWKRAIGKGAEKVHQLTSANDFKELLCNPSRS